MRDIDFKTLLKKYNDGDCTPEEREVIEAWYLQLELEDGVKLTDSEVDEIMSMRSNIAVPKSSPMKLRIAVAAAVLVVSSIAILFYRKTTQVPVKHSLVQAQDVKPGKQQAMLTLSSGEQITLDTLRSGQVVNQGSVTVSKAADGQLVYRDGGSAASAKVVINTISTPRGGEYAVVLIDGTKAWLNAASSITYPSRFAKEAREVEITGEVYFEVAHKTSQPFRVKSRMQVVEVLGTHFNINAYIDEPTVKTTLTEGSVRVRSSGRTKQLIPNQQASVSSNQLAVTAADVDEVMAWHYGDFIFNQKSLLEVMRCVARWYDVEIDFSRYKPLRQTFTGEISRKKNLSVVLAIIERTAKVKFHLDGKRLTIIN